VGRAVKRVGRDGFLELAIRRVKVPFFELPHRGLVVHPGRGGIAGKVFRLRGPGRHPGRILLASCHYPCQQQRRHDLQQVHVGKDSLSTWTSFRGAGQNYMVSFDNTAGIVNAGDKVTVVMDEFCIADLTVQ
jgi:hypothetical protein